MLKVTNTEENKKSFKRGVTIVKLMTASLLVIISAGCGKKDKNQDANYNYVNEVTEEPNTYTNVTEEPQNNDSALTYGRKPLGGSFIDKHNQELYISKASDLDKVVEIEVTPTPAKSSSNNSSKGNNVSSSNNSNSNANNIVVDNTNEGVVANPEVGTYIDQEGNTVTQFADGSYVVTPQFNPPVENNTDYNPYISNNNPYVPDNSEMVPGNNVEAVVEPTPVYSGYVMRKLNYGDNGYWYSFYSENGSLMVMIDDMSMMSGTSMDPNNSNILGLSNDKNKAGWVYVCDNNEVYQYLDSCDNLDAQLNSQIVEANKAREEANGFGLGLTP